MFNLNQLYKSIKKFFFPIILKINLKENLKKI
jgi:hypothetical protein